MPSSAPPHTSGAVFLSYARNDFEAARRIADALRGFGVEVWFDQAELRGGDAWDQQIRRHIRECALFVPVISGTTQARAEGYFRREWKLAVDRTHDMAHGMAFILPVVIDDMHETDALVPEEFLRVQWTRLPGGVPTPEFVDHIKRLLDPSRRVVPPVRSSPPPGASTRAAARARKPPLPGWTWGALAAVAVGVAVALLAVRKREPLPPVPQAEPVAPSTPSGPVSAPGIGKSIAVLPFANFSTDKENEFFADGLHDEIITALAKIHDLKVISRTSVMAYRNPEGRNLRKIAAELGVANILEGSVQRMEGKVHLNVQLIDAPTDEHIWADSYTKDLKDVFTVESDLAVAVTAALKSTLSPEERNIISQRPTSSQEAYDAYLRAQALGEGLSVTSPRAEIERVIALYERAASLDPSFALPHVQASILHGFMYWYARLDPSPARMSQAQAELDLARRLAPDTPETHLAEGVFEYCCRNDWAKALERLRLAEPGLPNSAQLQFRIGVAYRRLGRMPEALRCMERATALDPNNVLQVEAQTETLFMLRRYGQLTALCQRELARFADDAIIRRFQYDAQFELDGDRRALRRALAPLPVTGDSTGQVRTYGAAMLLHDYDAAQNALADPRLSTVTGSGGVLDDPVQLHRALVAWLRHKPEEATRYADEAVAAYRARRCTPRQACWVEFGIARAEAYAGRAEAAFRDGRSALETVRATDGYSALVMNFEFGQLEVVVGRREEALRTLREIWGAPSLRGPNWVRVDPVWSQLGDDPRFEQILRTAKPL